MTVGRFIAGIAALIWHPASQKYLLLRRAPSKDVGAGHWECVTGRVDQGEGYVEALHREVQEELGIDVQIEYLLGTNHFYRGTAVVANELLGVVYGCALEDPEAIEVSDEHDAFMWLTAAEVAGFLPADHWLQECIRRAEQFHRHWPDALRIFHRENGFELG